MIHVLMVCTANVCRSPMAQIVATEIARRNGLAEHFHFESAGTHASKSRMRMDTRAVKALERRGYPVKKLRARPIEIRDFQRFDIILAMDRTNYAELHRICPTESNYKLRMFLPESQVMVADEILDPYYGNSEGFERVLDLCEVAAIGLVNRTIR